jgi:lipoprotein NlpD
VTEERVFTESKRIWGARVALLGASCAILLLAACSTYTGPVPVVDRSARSPAGAARSAAAAAPATAPVPDGYYVVKKGDTLYSIALEHGADYRDVAQWNGMDDPTKLSVGQRLRVKAPPDAVQVGTARGSGRPEARPLDAPAGVAAGASAIKTEPRAQRLPYSKENVAAIARQEPKPEAKPESKPEARPEDGAIAFIWPAKGKVIAGFAEPRSKGIDIDGKIGDPIVAAAAGRVTYIGNGIPGLGKLVVLKHDNGFITVYAHNKDILVKEQQSVARGQKIAEMGATDSDRPKLHFQIRKGSSPVDPMRYLPGS